MVVSTSGCGYATEATSSGVVVDEGLVLTAAHSVRGSSTVTVTGPDGVAHTAGIAGLDMRTDLALLSVPNLSAPPLEMGTATTGDTGEIVGASSSGTVPYLVRRAVDITIDRIGGRGGHERSGYELEADTRKGDSGSGAFDPDGRLIGIVFATADDASGATWVTAGNEVSAFLAVEHTGPWVCDPDESRVLPPASMPYG
ncbi:MAG: Serine protease [Acidimicrobiaceae bacterium]|nr:Serine protease [Acidimicrobiaceae bacterium]